LLFADLVKKIWWFKEVKSWKDGIGEELYFNEGKEC
jgi:hypothetical protein